MSIVSALATSTTVNPVVMFHGLNGSCSQIDGWVDIISEGINHAAPVKCVEIGDGNDTSLFTSMPHQVRQACKNVANDPDFVGKPISVIGISQGGLIARAFVEQCAEVDVDILFTFGGPHMGVSAICSLTKNKWLPLNMATGWLALRIPWI